MKYIDPTTKLFRHMDRLDAIQKGRIQGPVNVEIDLSNRCSLGCEWCHMAYTHTRGQKVGKQDKPEGAIPGGDLMDYRLAVNTIKELEECGVRSITWTGGGEPTLHPQFARIIALTLIDQGVYTNGTNLTSENVKAIKQYCKWVYVSLDAADRESYQNGKGADKFGEVCNGIEELANAPGDATIGVGYLVTSSNWQNAAKAVDLAKLLGADYIQFRPTVLFYPKRPGQLVEDTGWMNEAIGEIGLLKDDFVIADLERFRMYRDWTGHNYPLCYWSGVQATITPNGKVWTCVNKREHPGAELGDLNKERFVEIWKRRKIAKVDEHCRVVCRGHPANLILNELMKKNEHGNFI